MQLKELDWNQKYKVEVINTEIEGIFDSSRRVYDNCTLESLSGGDAEFSFDLDEEVSYEDLADIPDANIICIAQSDIDNGYAIVSVASLVN